MGGWTVSPMPPLPCPFGSRRRPSRAPSIPQRQQPEVTVAPLHKDHPSAIVRLKRRAVGAFLPFLFNRSNSTINQRLRWGCVRSSELLGALFRCSKVAQDSHHQDGVSSADVDPLATLVSCLGPRNAPSHTPTSTKPLPIMKESVMLSLKSHAARTTVEIGKSRYE